jgi:hypothetical protein
MGWEEGGRYLAAAGSLRTGTSRFARPLECASHRLDSIPDHLALLRRQRRRKDMTCSCRGSGTGDCDGMRLSHPGDICKPEPGMARVGEGDKDSRWLLLGSVEVAVAWWAALVP